MAYQMTDASSAVDSELFWAWSDAVRDGLATPAEAVDGQMAGVWPEFEEEFGGGDVATPALAGAELVSWYSAKIGRKFERSDIDSNGELGTALYDAARQWLLTADVADFLWSEWLAKLATKLRKYKNQTDLSNGEAKGVLNCYAATLRRAAQPKAPQPVSAPAAPQKPENRAEDGDDAAGDAWLAFQAREVSRGYYTTVRQDGSHLTIKLGPWSDDKYRPGKKIRWIGYLTGPVNTANYTTFARQDEAGIVTPLRQAGPDLMAALNLILFGTKDERDERRHLYATESGNCARCNRVLTVPASIAMGLGPECAGKAF